MMMSSFCFWFVVVLCVMRGAVQAQYGGMELDQGLSPRYYLGISPLPQLGRRQSGVCPTDSHSCLDVNATACCPNSQYCIINSQFEVKCCDIGSLCGNACDDSHYQCSSSITISGTATVTSACCPRSCPNTSQFKCASAYGGGCCSFGSVCVSGHNCSPTTTSTSSKAAVTEIPSGCTTSQIACPSLLGGGCCGVGLSCTVVDNTNYCASAASTATRTGPDGILASDTANSSHSSGMSTGAKAGIGAGAALGACVVVGALLWFCVVHRRRERARRSQQGESERPALSQVEGENGRPGPGQRMGSDYFGPKATAGPFTDDGISPLSPGSSPGRGVPLSPQRPGDIAIPVEIDSRDHSNVTSPGYIDEHLKKGPYATEYFVEMP